MFRCRQMEVFSMKKLKVVLFVRIMVAVLVPVSGVYAMGVDEPHVQGEQEREDEETKEANQQIDRVPEGNMRDMAYKLWLLETRAAKEALLDRWLEVHDMYEEDQWGYTLFLSVLHMGQDEETVKLLIDKGVEVNRHTSWGIRPLVRAVEGENLEIVKLLVAHGAVFHHDIMEEDLLSGAVVQGNSEMVHFLIRQGMGIDIPDSEGELPLLIAAKNEDVQIMSQLIFAGAHYESVLYRNNDISENMRYQILLCVSHKEKCGDCD